MKYPLDFKNFFKIPTGDQTFLKDIEKRIHWMVYKGNNEIYSLIKDHHRESFFASHLVQSLFNFTSFDEKRYTTIDYPLCNYQRDLDVIQIFNELNNLNLGSFEPGLDVVKQAMKSKDLVLIIKSLDDYFDIQKEMINDFENFYKTKKAS